VTFVEAVSFTAVSVQVSVNTDGTPMATAASVVCSADARALAHAVAWQRNRRYLAPAAETADEVLALREMVSVIDALELAATGDGGPVHLTKPQVVLLTEAASVYVAERDHEDYTAPVERERIARLRALSDRLMGVAAEMAAALEHRVAH